MMELILIGTAYVIGFVASQLSFPPLVGYLVAGYILHGLNVAPLPNLEHLADIGIELLLFSVGLKLKPKTLLRHEVLSVGGRHLLIVAGISSLIFCALGSQTQGGLVLGISLAFSSTVLAIKVLEDSGELSSFHGRDVLSILILQDIVAIALLAFVSDKQPTIWAFALLLLPLLRPLAHRLLSASHASELQLLLGVFLALAGGVLADSVGVSADIGSLLAGVMLAGHSKIDELANKLWSLKEVFLVAFFLQIGLTDLPSMKQILYAVGLLALLPLQGVLIFALFLLAGLRSRTAFISSLALMTYSEFALITTGAVVKAELLPAEWVSIISLAVAGSLAIAAPLNRFSHRLFTWLEPVLVRFEKKSDHPDHLPESTDISKWLIVGMGRTGVAAYQALSAQKKRVLGLDADPTVLERLQKAGHRVVYGDIEDSELWSGLPLARVKGVILTVPTLEARCDAIDQLRKGGYAGQIGTVCYHDDEEAHLKSLGANFAIHPFVEAGNQLARQILDEPGADSAIEHRSTDRARAEVMAPSSI